MIYNGILVSHKKNEILLLVTAWMDLKGIMLGQISQRKRMYGFTYIWNLKKKNKYNKWESYRYRRQTGGWQRWGEERHGWGKLRGTYFQLQNKWVMDMKYIVRRI